MARRGRRGEAEAFLPAGTTEGDVEAEEVETSERENGKKADRPLSFSLFLSLYSLFLIFSLSFSLSLIM